MKNPSSDRHEEYTVLADATEEGFYKVEIKSGEFNGIIFNFGKVEFPDENEPILKFDYNILVGTIDESRKESFEKTMGDILVDLIQKALASAEITYKGGV